MNAKSEKVDLVDFALLQIFLSIGQRDSMHLLYDIIFAENLHEDNWRGAQMNRIVLELVICQA